jgi:hypothetical protein
LMRNGRDRRSEKRVVGHREERTRAPVWDRSADHIRTAATAAASHGGKSPSENRPDTWLHPDASQRSQIFPLHRGRCPYMAPSASSRRCSDIAIVGGTPDGRWTWPIPTVLTPSRHGWSEECRAETFGGGCRRRPCSISTYTLSYPPASLGSQLTWPIRNHVSQLCQSLSTACKTRQRELEQGNSPPPLSA